MLRWCWLCISLSARTDVCCLCLFVFRFNALNGTTLRPVRMRFRFNAQSTKITSNLICTNFSPDLTSFQLCNCRSPEWGFYEEAAGCREVFVRARWRFVLGHEVVRGFCNFTGICIDSATDILSVLFDKTTTGASEPYTKARLEVGNGLLCGCQITRYCVVLSSCKSITNIDLIMSYLAKNKNSFSLLLALMSLQSCMVSSLPGLIKALRYVLKQNQNLLTLTTWPRITNVYNRWQQTVILSDFFLYFGALKLFSY